MRDRRRSLAGGEMTFKKTLVAILCMFMVSFAFYAQSAAGDNPENGADGTALVSSFENNTDYFNASGALQDSAGPTESSLRRGSGGILLFLRMIIVLIIVVGLVYGLLWFIKNKTNVVKTEDEFLRRAAYINIAPGKTVEVITLIDRAYVIGVTEDGITLLGEFNSKSDAETAQMINAMNLRADQKQNVRKPVNFSDVMEMFLAKKGRVKNVFSEEEEHLDAILKEKGSSEGEENEKS